MWENGTLCQKLSQTKITVTTVTFTFVTKKVFKLSTAEEVGHSSAYLNTPRPQPHTRFKQSKTIREITISENKHSNNRDTDKFNTLFVQLQVSNVCTDAVLDTAAQVSVMSYKFYQKLRSSPVLSDHVMFKGIDKSNLDSRICNNVPIEFGQFKSKWNFVVADISDSILLGLDFLEHHQAIINLQDFSEFQASKLKCP